MRVNLQEKVGHRFVSTIRVENHPWQFETIVFGGKDTGRIAYMETYQDEKQATRVHKTIAKDVRKNPDNYDLRKRKWYERTFTFN